MDRSGYATEATGATSGSAPTQVAFLMEQCWHTVPGGTAVAAAGLAAALHARSDVEVVGLAAHHDGPPEAGPVPPVPVAHSRLPRPLLYEAWHRLGRPRVERMIPGRASDLVHASGGAVPATDLPIVATVHDLAWRHHPEHATGRGRRLFEAWLDDARRAAAVTCPSQATRDDLLAAGFGADRLHVVPLGTDPVEVDPGRVEALRERHGLSGPFVLWVGTAEPRKNLFGLVAAMERIPDVPLVLVGPTGWNEDAARAVEPLGRRAVVVGRVDEADKYAWYAAADVFAMPSLLEGFGLPLLEAMGQGTPVVTSSGTATAEVVGEAGLTVDPTDPDALAGAIAGLLDDPEAAAELGSAGRDRAATMTWEAAAGATAAVYREVLAGAAAAPAAVSPTGTAGPVQEAGPAPVASPVPARAQAGTPNPARPARIAVNLLHILPGGVGGSEEYAVRTLSAFARHGPDDITPVLFVQPGLPGAHPGLCSAFDTVVCPVDGSNRALRIAAESTWLRRRTDGFDAVHHLGGRLPAATGRPAAVTVHDLQPLEHPERFSPAKRAFLGWSLPRSLARADVVVAVSRRVADQLEDQAGVDPQRVAVVSCGTRQRAEVPTAAPGHPVVIYPAVTHPHKNHLMLIEAFALLARRHPGASLLLTGAPGAADTEVRAAADASGVGHSITFAGRLPEEDLADLLAGSTLLAFPSRYEGFGIPVLEAMAAGVPVVVAAGTAAADLAADTGMVLEPDDPQAWAAEMGRIIERDTWRRQVARAGLVRAADHTWEDSAHALEQAWRLLLRVGRG